ncbi:YrzI family small protein [Bacillus mesophilus]|uniref:YrzI family small protein n=1 Tax=Bacillus mesophilus TaxID=1808955 RepID=A0A6M0Q5V6_9BACI|nr:YrzI family small protein [Bacillus mesophilus]
MTFNILFFCITINKRNYSEHDIFREQKMNSISNQMQEHKSSFRHFI